MKNVFLLSLLLLTCNLVYSQDTVKRSNALTSQLLEEYSVLKSNKKLRQGEYYAIYMQKSVLAKGRYEAGKRVGEWNYFTPAGKLIQTFDYDKYQFKYLDTSGRKTVQYYFPQNITKNDTISNPIVIGGYYYTLVPLTFHKELFDDIRGDFSSGQKIIAKHVLTISPEGVILKHEVIATADGKTTVYKLDDKEFDDGNKKVIPAMINHQPVMCEITMELPMSYTTTTSSTTIVTRSVTSGANRNGF